jgi:hypothetical protein
MRDISPFVAYPGLPHFSTLPHKQRDYRKDIIEHKMCVLIFSTNLSEKSNNLRRIQQYIILIRFRRNVKYTLSYQNVTKVEFSRYIFEKHSNFKFHENPFCGSQVVRCIGTDGL